MRKRAFAVILVLALLGALCGCEQNAEQTTAPSENTVAPALEEQFQNEVTLLREFRQTGLLDGVSVSPAEFYAYSYYGFLAVADHPGAQEYLDRFYIVEDVVVSQTYHYHDMDYTEYYEYDTQGRLTAESVIKGDELQKITYVYSDAESYHGKVSAAELWTIMLDGTGSLSTRIQYTYYDDGTLRMAKTDKSKIYYDENGKITQEIAPPAGMYNGGYVAPYKVGYQIDYLYDENGALAEVVKVTTHTSIEPDEPSLDFTYTFEDRTAYTCDDSGRPVSADASCDYSDITNHYTWEYDEAGNLIRELREEYCGEVWNCSEEAVYTYENGLLVKTEFIQKDQDGTESSVLEYTYGDYIGYTVE